MTKDSFFLQGPSPGAPARVLRQLVLDPFGVRVDGSSALPVLLDQVMWAKGFESPILPSSATLKAGELLAKNFVFWT